MSLRPYGKAEIDQSKPRALAVCDRCGHLWNHYRLRWQYDWRGTKLQNLRFLVCPDCYDDYQQNGQRTIILPIDPEPIMNARLEAYVPADNPLSAIGANPTPTLQRFSAQIGTMTKAAGIPAAFDGNINKPSFLSAMIVTPDSSFGNYVGINWSEYPAGTYPANLDTPLITHTLGTFLIAAPNDSTFGSSSYVVQGSALATTWDSWTTLASGNTAQTVGEVITGGVTAGGKFQFHRVAFNGAQTGENLLINFGAPMLSPQSGNGGAGGPIAVAQVQFNVVDLAEVTITSTLAPVVNVIQTTLTQAASDILLINFGAPMLSPNSNTLMVVSTAGFNVGDPIKVKLDDGSFFDSFVNQIVSPTEMNIVPTLPSLASAGNVVIDVR